MHNGIHNLIELIEYLAEEAICEVGWRQCGQLYFMADDLGISVGELEALCEYFEINVEMFVEKYVEISVDFSYLKSLLYPYNIMVYEVC